MKNTIKNIVKVLAIFSIIFTTLIVCRLEVQASIITGFDNALELKYNEKCEGTLETPLSVNYYKFTTKNVDAYYHFDFNNYEINTENLCIMDFDIFDSNKILISTTVNVYKDSNRRYSIKLEKNSTYYLVAKNSLSVGINNQKYDITMTYKEDPESDNMKSATTINEGKFYNATLASGNDTDYFKFVATETKNYDFYLKNIDCPAEILHNPILIVYNSSGVMQTLPLIGIKGSEVSTRYKVTKGKTYYLKVRLESADEYCYGKYSIAVGHRLDKITLNKTSVNVMRGKTYQLTTKFNPTNPLHRELKWITTNPYVCSVSSTGKIKALHYGTAEIICNGTDISAGLTKVPFVKCRLYVTPVRAVISKISTPSKGKVTISIKKDGEATGYQVYYSTSLNGKYKKLKTIDRYYNNIYSKTKLISNKKYYFKVRIYKHYKVNGKITTRYGQFSKIIGIKIK